MIFVLQFLFEAAINHCVDLATDRHGCCVLQKCLSHSEGELRRHLVCEVTSKALILSQDPFGYYAFPPPIPFCPQFFECSLMSKSTWGVGNFVAKLLACACHLDFRF